MVRKIELIAVSLALAVGAIACSTAPQIPLSELESHAIAQSQEYRIGAHDVLSISVWQQEDLSLPEVVVRLDGKISFPLLDDVQAEGLTAFELKKLLTERLTEYITAPHVTVVVRQINSKTVYVIGELKREGPIQLRSGMRVVDALSTAGGFRTFAAKNRVKVIRNMNGSGNIEFLFDYPEFAAGDNIEQNILLLPGDRIVVPEQSPFWR